MQDFPIGAHLVTPRLGYAHHGIYAGGGRVIHYAGFKRLFRRGPVEEVSLEAFADGRPVTLRRHAAPRFAGAAAVARARARLGERRYRFWSNNCEHFAEWCIGGVSRSPQVEARRDFIRNLGRLPGNCAATLLGQSAAMKRGLLSFLLLLLAAGCATHDPSPVKAAPAASASSIQSWWTLFGDRQLERLMEEALERNADLEIAVARVREAQASLDVARSAQSPLIELQADSARSRQSGATGSRHRVAAAAAYEVDLFGRLSSATAAARHQLLSTEWARASVEWSLTAALAEGYFGLAAVERQIVITEAVREGWVAAAGVRQRELAAGAGTELDLRRAQAELAATESTLAALGRSRAALVHAVTLLLGRTPEEIASGTLAANALDESKPIDAALPQGAAERFLVRRPDVREAEALVAAANASVDAARAATLPSLQLSGVLGSDARSLSDLFSAPAALWSIGASLTYALADGGRAKGRVREEQARAEQALAGYRRTLANAVLDVQEAYAALELTQQALQAERERVAALARARQLARLGHQHGALNYIDLLDAERNWQQARLQQVSAYRDRLVGQVATYKALGGGYAGAL